MTDLIIKAFADIGLIPRDNQVETVQRIVDAFASGKRHVFLDAPTGSGKSVLAMVAHKVLNMRAVIVTATNSLVEQYHKDFTNVPIVIGAGNYPCELRNRLFKTSDAKADNCYKKSRFFYMQFPSDGAQPPECAENACSFVKSRVEKHQAISITNYPYYIIDQLYIKTLPNKDESLPNTSAYNVELGIFDEAHMINEQFSAHYNIHYTAKRSQEFLADIRKLTGQEDSQMEMAYSSVFNIINENVERGSIGLVNVDKFLNMLKKFYFKMTEIIDNKKIYEKGESGYDALGQMKSKYHGLFCKIDDYFKYKYEVVVDVKKAEKSLSVQPVFMGETSSQFCQKKNLYMSATMNYEYMVGTMKLDPEECVLIKVDYVFNADDKIIDMTRAKRKINYANMHSDEVIAEFHADLEDIYKLHADQSGVVIATSFKMAELLSHAKSATHDIILHENSEPAREVIRRFKNTSRPTILISPSLFEGVDLPGIESQFQVMPKAPYLSLGSKRMFYISRKHRGVYLQMSIMRMIQGCGRSTRFVGDKATTYMLDLNCGTLLRSRHNTWREQFKLIK